MTKEIYYAIRIGNPRKHFPYFMLDDSSKQPHLFSTLKEARSEFGKKSHMYNCAVVKVVLQEAR